MEKSRLRHGHSLPEVPQHRVPQQGLLSPAPRFREAKKAFNLPTRTQTPMGNEPQVVGAKRVCRDDTYSRYLKNYSEEQSATVEGLRTAERNTAH